MEKGDSKLNIRAQSQDNLNEFNNSALPATSSSLKLPLIIVGCALVLALVLGLSIGLTNRGKKKKINRVNIVKTNSTSLSGWDESYRKAEKFISKLSSMKELIFCLEQKI